MAWHPDGDQVAFGLLGEKSIHLFDVATQELIRVIPLDGHGRISSLVWRANHDELTVVVDGEILSFRID